MSKLTSDQRIIAILNRVFMAYFQNIAEGYGIDFYNTRPTESITKSMIGAFFVPDVDYDHMREFYIGKFHLDGVNLEKLRESRVEEWIDENVKSKIHYLAIQFSNISKEYPYSDYIFSMLPDCLPFISDCSMDCDTNFISRTIFVNDFMNNSVNIIFEFYCLIVERWRKVDSEKPLYGEKYQTVSSMTPEQREKFDKQPEKESE